MQNSKKVKLMNRKQLGVFSYFWLSVYGYAVGMAGTFLALRWMKKVCLLYLSLHCLSSE